jgi:hypothetical protein
VRPAQLSRQCGDNLLSVGCSFVPQGLPQDSIPNPPIRSDADRGRLAAAHSESTRNRIARSGTLSSTSEERRRSGQLKVAVFRSTVSTFRLIFRYADDD